MLEPFVTQILSPKTWWFLMLCLVFTSFERIFSSFRPTSVAELLSFLQNYPCSRPGCICWWKSFCIAHLSSSVYTYIYILCDTILSFPLYRWRNCVSSGSPFWCGFPWLSRHTSFEGHPYFFTQFYIQQLHIFKHGLRVQAVLLERVVVVAAASMYQLLHYSVYSSFIYL